MLCEIARSADWHSSASPEAAKGIDPGGETRRAAPACDSRRVLHLDDVAARRSMACRRELMYPRTKFDLGTYHQVTATRQLGSMVIEKCVFALIQSQRAVAS